MEDIVHNLSVIQNRIAMACKKSERDAASVQLLLATKTVDPQYIVAAINAGYTLIGENKVQEIKDKYESLKSSNHQTHFIGHLQTNKIKDIIKYKVQCIQSLDRIDLATKLHERLLVENRTIDVLIQVNTSNEETKFGVPPDKVVHFVRKISAYPTLKIKGLMTIALFSAVAEQVRPCFKLLKTLSEQIKRENIPNVVMQDLSMGMSGDLETAIEEGATIIRVGTAIFGKRIYPDSYYWNEDPKQPNG